MPQPLQPLINGQAYSWSQIKINALNVTLVGVDEINYEDEQEMEDGYGAGNFPVRRGYGKYAAKADITLHMEELEGLAASVPTGRLQDIPEFDIVVSYLPEDGLIVNHTIHNCRLKNNGRSVKQGDPTISKQIQIQTSHISWK